MPNIQALATKGLTDAVSRVSSSAVKSVGGLFSKSEEKKVTEAAEIATSTSGGNEDRWDRVVAAQKPSTNTTATTEQVSAQTVKYINPAPDVEDRSFMVSLRNKQTGDLVEFEVMPEVTENRSASYEPVQPPQFPGAFQKYKGTESTRWGLNATLICRSSAEADNNLRIINLVRSWLYPFYGDRTALSYKDFLFNKTGYEIAPTGEKRTIPIGSPPPVLEFRGFKDLIIGTIPVVLVDASWNWPRDVDYIQTIDGTPFPTVIQITLNLVESFSVTEFNNFNLRDFASGRMVDAYNISTITAGGSAGKNSQSTRVSTSVSDHKEQPEAQYVSGAKPGSGTYDPRRLDQETSDPRIVGGGKGRGSINPPMVKPTRSEPTSTDNRTILDTIGGP